MFKVSKGNSKLGIIYNMNVPVGITCAPDAPCQKEGCYAKKGNYTFSNVKQCYSENLQSYYNNPEQAEQDILLQLPHVESEYFTLYARWHSSGDIVDMRYLHMMISIAEKRPYMKFLAFTKKYDLVNEYLQQYGDLPENLNIIYSHWRGYPMNNEYSKRPVAVVKELKDEGYIPNFECNGHCDLCFRCWNMQPGEVVQFKKH